ncbi:hypothetical protein MYSTI_02748 [Myxococcus stipitatus DSM 14675]|uniref:DUF2169 domain-containing protein n=1 Tax=Myxococcus stipitatus (strain DSM 14675 / JCM 12634 / Mx s8) TaxID=1278073 RepID=L7UC74_MYXSD|nr:DUF2169 domain-containing protein [Myxococcus stipitatus]AGC44064.1 hypothetical protein MYSTI_02748 [Myxococcus stipitatus DSM 14675]
MEITSNTTGLQAGLSVATDKGARDHCVVALKGTFQTNTRGEMTLATEQRPLVTADEHYGNPGSSSVRYECDFVLEKPLTDVIVVGSAVAPGSQRVTVLPVRLEVQGRTKDLMVYGERRWERSLRGVVASKPLPFIKMPLTFELAFGGQDDSRGAGHVVVEPRNLVGMGFHPHRSAALIVNTHVPNIERRGDTISSPRDRHEPAGLGCVGRAWQPRVAHGGTYDEHWRDECAPFLPADFDSRYHQCAPVDQQFPHFRGGERIRCVHMAEEGPVHYVIPTLNLPVRFRFLDGDLLRTPVLDTITLEPHLGLAMLVWRTSVPLRKKLTALREILIGERPARTASTPLGHRNGKPVFAGLGAAVTWLREQRRGQSR